MNIWTFPDFWMNEGYKFYLGKPFKKDVVWLSDGYQTEHCFGSKTIGNLKLILRVLFLSRTFANDAVYQKSQHVFYNFLTNLTHYTWSRRQLVFMRDSEGHHFKYTHDAYEPSKPDMISMTLWYARPTYFNVLNSINI